MRVTAVIGSPRKKGNSAAIVGMLLEALKPAAAPKVFELNGMSYRGCQACMACKTGSETCVVKDDLTGVLDEINVSDVVIVASPVYIGEVTAQAKGLIDRFFCLLKPDYRTNANPGRLAPGKSLIFVVPQGNPDEAAFADMITRYAGPFRRFGFSKMYPLRALGAGPQSDMRQDRVVVERVARIAAEILAG
jgi:multimeric flavodoxin WrbA